VKKSRFKALPRSAIARIQLGTIQSQRSEELLKAAARSVSGETSACALFSLIQPVTIAVVAPTQSRGGPLSEMRSMI
jgi:hypothetical protein